MMEVNMGCMKMVMMNGQLQNSHQQGNTTGPAARPAPHHSGINNTRSQPVGPVLPGGQCEPDGLWARQPVHHYGV
jgi:hypothetical protein